VVLIGRNTVSLQLMAETMTGISNSFHFDRALGKRAWGRGFGAGNLLSGCKVDSSLKGKFVTGFRITVQLPTGIRKKEAEK